MRLFLILYFLINSTFSLSEEAYFMQASFYESVGDIEKAEKFYKRALKYAKGKSIYPYISFNLAELFYKKGRIKEAEYFYKNSLPYHKAYERLVELYIIRSEFRKASILIEETLKNKEDENLLYLGAELYIQLAKFDKAEEYLKKILEKNPYNLDAIIKLAELLKEEKRLEEAESLLKEAKNKLSSEPSILYSLADIYKKRKKYKAAEEILLKLLVDFPYSEVIKENIISLYLLQDKLQEAEKLINSLNKEKYTYWWFQAIYYEKKGEVEAAKNAYYKTIESDPEFIPPYFALACISIDENNIKLAEEYLWKIKDEYSEELYSLWAEILIQQALREDSPQLYREKLNLALYTLSSALNIYKDSYILYFKRGVVKERLNLFYSAISDFYKSISLNSDFSPAYNYIGYMYAERGINLDEAEKLINKAIELKRDFSPYIDSLAWVLFKKGKIKEAQEKLEEAIEKAEEDDPIIREHLGDVYYAEKRFKEAIEQYRISLNLWEERKKKLPQDFISQYKKILELKRQLESCIQKLESLTQ